MANLFYQLRRLMTWPYHRLFSRDRLGGGRGGGLIATERSRALLLGMPAIIFAVVGVGLLCWAKYGLASSLESTYRSRAEKSATDKQRVYQDLMHELQELRAELGDDAADRDSQDELIPKDDERLVEFEKLQNQEEAYWKKLRELNPDEPEYLFQLALISWGKRDVNLSFAQMNVIAPLDEPGYVKGHLWLAKQFLNIRARTPLERQKYLGLANRHADQCLKRDRDNIDAKLIKARVFSTVGNYSDSYQYFLEATKSDVRFFRNLITINQLVNRDDRNEAVLRDAVVRYWEIIENETTEEKDRIQGWSDMAYAYRELGEYKTIERLLLDELERADDSADESEEDLARRIRMERRLATVYHEWGVSLVETDTTTMNRRLELLKQAFHFNSNSPNTMKALTRLGYNDDESIATAAKLIYDPDGKRDLPALVLNELGIRALGRSRYADAIRYFENARTLDPKNSEYLNNLAYSYLQSDPPDPERARKLIDEALRFLPRKMNQKVYLSSFHDTRGRALMQLGQTAEAIAEFEVALKNREEARCRGILEALVECYDRLGLDSQSYKKRLEELDELEALQQKN